MGKERASLEDTGQPLSPLSPQPAAGQEQQHRQPPGQGRPGHPSPRLRHLLPGLPHSEYWDFQAETLQCGGSCLLSGEPWGLGLRWNCMEGAWTNWCVFLLADGPEAEAL